MDGFMEFVRDFRPEAACISCTTANVNDGIALALELKSRDKSVLVILGGVHPTALPGEILKNKAVDIVVRGEGEETINELFTKIGPKSLSKVRGISYRHNGKIMHNPDRGLIHDLDGLPLPAYHLLPLDRYERAYIMTSRGCPGHCTFCGSHIIFGRRTRYRSHMLVVDEMEMLKKYGFDYIWFTDDTFTLDKKRTHDICDEIIRRGLKMKWICMSRVNTVDGELLLKMKRAGCIRVNFGIECGDVAVIRKIKKGIRIEDVRKAFGMAKEAGLETTAYLMVGLPGQTWKSVLKTNELLKEIRPTITSVTVLVPYPDTEIYMEMKRAGIIKDDSQKWEDFGVYKKGEIASPYVMRLDGKISGLTEEEIIKAYNLLTETGRSISTHNKFKSPRVVLRSLLRIRSFGDVKRNLRQLSYIFRKIA
jgi:radical SAM superfamily enzyme YgiQ (UPF0313 family)